MATPEWERAAILRLCQRCQEWRSVDAFKLHGHVCQRCSGHDVSRGRARTIVLIPQPDDATTSKAG